MRLMHTSTILFTSILLPRTLALCYYPNGAIATSDVPCSSSGESTCCASGYACLSNNLCKLTQQAGAGLARSAYARGSCTDQSWKSDHCSSFCLTPSKSGGNVRKCDNYDGDVYYCMNDTTTDLSLDSACAGAAELHTFSGSPTVITTIGVVPTTSFTSTILTTNPAVTIPAISASPSSVSSPRDYSVAIGTGVGIPLGVLSVGILIFLFTRYQRNKSPAASEIPYSRTEKYGYAPELSVPPVELPSGGTHELSTGQRE
ncbi:uncharacterized protein BDR25DRAFT_343722 [Lindgomyces ingoldianus]|uniref:Uncharacterized protein n=1 Tax=Lindgomyces ingoldianus TaxID=673940 RepID=A0ACB6QQP4_9PLEO|nr:uncharacterized protein BDR25DRAFT_343722 [Lindgomyces ingoldianus]KAF2469323.1 hypothetical protein BDR25DRAFT_343722 [Lindgomyces ingoldianus]